MKFSIGVFCLSVFVLASCKKSSDSALQSTYQSNTESYSFYCQSVSKKDGMEIDQKAEVIVNKKNVNILYEFETNISDVGKHTGGKLINAQVNTIFDFNRISAEYIYVATSPSTVKVSSMDKSYDENIGLLIVSINQGTLSVKEDSKDQEILNVENCAFQR